MPPPPDTADDDASPRLTWAEDGAPRSGRFGDVYFSADDGLAESRAVFLQGCGLPQAWAGRATFTVAELGFGTGLNILSLLDLWRREGPANARLHVFTVEGFPLSRDEAARALAAWPELAEISGVLLDRWPAGDPGVHRIDLPGFNAVIDVAVGEVVDVLSAWTGRADAWFLDGFSPALNPGMWSEPVLDLIAARSAPGARLATFTVAGFVRRGLTQRGFQVDKRPGHGRKRERLEATLRPTVAVIGAGIAGASVARALIAAGCIVTVVEADRPGAGGSGFPAALVTPRLDAGDVGIASFHAQALDRARELYATVPDAIVGEGVVQLHQTDRDAARFDRIAAQSWWSPGAMTVIDVAGATARLGEETNTGGLLMAGALAVAPAPILSAWIEGARRMTGTVAAITPGESGGRSLTDPDGVVIAEVDSVVITAGWGAAALAPDLDLRPVRGQASWVEGGTTPAVAWGGYAVPTTDGLLFGATHDRDDVGTDVRPADTERNLQTLAARLPRLAQVVGTAGPIQARAAVRATTRDRLPVCGALSDQPGLYVLGGLGSRGFCVAPLLGEHIAAVVTGVASPMADDMAERLAPGRFAGRRP
ncbi:tRNA 5-methylaminomethyl-2-thiouridine biosynthesis bifunctional protein MnmC [Brevundimonas sp. NIBR10]|uniref:FAD-dependent 5-carboxymethylaminomethyl-2-thiouridine(34) oxidoreductase MnmC n=1 Tax=Brevundimonas sp. NIBR10 TaxID=3015997 RepID=UPI0022F1C062|nr:FAD-dependent 5-carboxymethylaminomethyl-2-thiouridine(34) oxidoreductase MnmC [Brevundimonas sp. NIBR10]WGM46251.1 tRNA 5-methylaminomethyl-2-thiouridine biosynthesis bifunctional protein MnmC [Brevundimonas sp. NIBR10]